MQVISHLKSWTIFMKKKDVLPINNSYKPIIYTKYSGIDAESGAACGYCLDNHHHAQADAEDCAWVAK